jgi:hypothetical protein
MTWPTKRQRQNKDKDNDKKILKEQLQRIVTLDTFDQRDGETDYISDN